LVAATSSKISRTVPAASQSRPIVCSAQLNPAQSRRDVLKFAAVLLGAGALSSQQALAEGADKLTAALIAKSEANKALNDRARLNTSSANQGRAYTVQNGSCKFPDNFTGCQDLARRKDVKFLSADLKTECAGKEPGKCGSNNLY
jgi:photosystem I subunit PsaN